MTSRITEVYSFDAEARMRYNFMMIDRADVFRQLGTLLQLSAPNTTPLALAARLAPHVKPRTWNAMFRVVPAVGACCGTLLARAIVLGTVPTVCVCRGTPLA